VPWIVISSVIGVFLVFAPWTALWDANWLTRQLWPAARGLVLSGFARGAVMGLGVVNLLLALRDLYVRVVGDESPPWGGPDAE
jgi:hypothetical protein